MDTKELSLESAMFVMTRTIFNVSKQVNKIVKYFNYWIFKTQKHELTAYPMYVKIATFRNYQNLNSPLAKHIKGL